ncbi:hypothetical protein BFJ63_vAg15462 [Fusarium oxysporum f. sp. narcissi]|uniref:Uncharacterized protein n=1 Tax=Fusarium oxysporum f. sp. narcissi TaxID=451672 RepID=A0A4Q2V3M7_FUSOX|nr:hypothetical protein BFJ63_vAg15462 [Fusarium oxysporum f. sp. narcissi]
MWQKPTKAEVRFSYPPDHLEALLPSVGLDAVTPEQDCCIILGALATLKMLSYREYKKQNI